MAASQVFNILRFLASALTLATEVYIIRAPLSGSVAQSVEQRTFNPLVPSSNLGRPTKKLRKNKQLSQPSGWLFCFLVTVWSISGLGHGASCSAKMRLSLCGHNFLQQGTTVGNSGGLWSLLRVPPLQVVTGPLKLVTNEGAIIFAQPHEPRGHRQSIIISLWSSLFQQDGNCRL